MNRLLAALPLVVVGLVLSLALSPPVEGRGARGRVGAAAWPGVTGQAHAVGMACAQSVAASPYQQAQIVSSQVPMTHADQPAEVGKPNVTAPNVPTVPAPEEKPEEKPAEKPAASEAAPATVTAAPAMQPQPLTTGPFPVQGASMPVQQSAPVRMVFRAGGCH